MLAGQAVALHALAGKSLAGQWPLRGNTPSAVADALPAALAAYTATPAPEDDFLPWVDPPAPPVPRHQQLTQNGILPVAQQGQPAVRHYRHAGSISLTPSAHKHGRQNMYFTGITGLFFSNLRIEFISQMSHGRQGRACLPFWPWPRV